jgi:o-succinylbenzoate---CoA ligase
VSLSITDAANEAPERIGLIAGDRRFDHAALAELAIARAASIPASAADPFVARRDLDSVVRLLALLERGIAAAPLHPRLPEDQQRALADRVGAWAAADPEPAATILFTSGTRGRPRGVVHDRAALIAAADASAAHLGWRPDDRWLCALPLAHAGGLSILIRCLRGRRCAVLAPEDLAPAALHDLLAEQAITLVSLVPTQLADLIDRGPPPPSLRAALIGGAATPASLVARARAAAWPVLPTYGLTESFGQVCTALPDAASATGGIDCGPPLPGWSVRADGGELRIRGPALMRGYLDEPAPLDDHGWMTTGDRGALDARGHLRVTGRADDTIVTGGENVHPTEIEELLLGCPGVRAACAFATPDPRWGQAVAAAIVGEVDAAAVEAFARARMAPHQRPRRLLLVDALPLGPTGKVDRRALRARLTGQ